MIQIQWTAANIEEARAIAKELVERKWVGCANLLPQIESIYLWEGKLEESSEIKVFLKTEDTFFQKVLEYIVENSSYDVPEVSKIQIDEANPSYEMWLKNLLFNTAD